ncbi:hypothetical protein [Rhodococcoides corynebacterioides]|uniref:ESX-1 secretion-associated protein n=1 Tax=Rhodococcoides corynebacterioides TaxID=53972 RepID=A0ABS7P2E6_9NOCA|nr:hypothetical protein [Rhodococcus corynebacterioides]MBY6366585.1 hypothetical protein [Rhodococcus corynebacterioides]MBY6408046.1 hypothetical protein [Rhodococcus corynebacterioides]
MSNQLNVSPEAANRCAATCDAFSEELNAIRAYVAGRGNVSGFGTLPSGVALNAKYTELTSGGPGSLTAMLQGHIEIATKLADTFRRMGEQYVETDEAVAATLHPSYAGGR